MTPRAFCLWLVVAYVVTIAALVTVVRELAELVRELPDVFG